MANADQFGFGTQIRKSPYFDATVRWGATGFSVYNHMYIPRDFGDPEQNFWNLVNAAILCDVAVERQVEITGPDATRFIQMLTPCNLSKLSVGQCKYIIVTNAQGGIINDPILLRLTKNPFGCRSRTAMYCFGRRVLPYIQGWMSQSANLMPHHCNCKAPNLAIS